MLAEPLSVLAWHFVLINEGFVKILGLIERKAVKAKRIACY